MRRYLGVGVLVLVGVAVYLWLRAPEPHSSGGAAAGPQRALGQASREARRGSGPVAAPRGASGESVSNDDAGAAGGGGEPELEALQARFTADPKVQAICELSPALDRARGYLAVGEPGSFDGRVVEVVLGQAFLPFLEGAGEGWLSVEGYGPTPVRWTAETEASPGGCAPEPLALRPGGAALTGRVTHEDGGAPAREAWVEGCGGFSRTDGDGNYFMEVVPGPCSVVAMRQDGQLRTLGAAVEARAREGEDVVVDLTIPGFARAGLGVGVAEHELGVAVNRVIEGSAAAEAGLEEGDIITGIDDAEVVDMELSEFVDAAGGREGSVVLLTLLRGEEELVIEIERRPVR